MVQLLCPYLLIIVALASLAVALRQWYKAEVQVTNLTREVTALRIERAVIVTEVEALAASLQ